jgi:hypothetical protein
LWLNSGTRRRLAADGGRTVDATCKQPGCQKTAVASIGSLRYCRGHFLELCYERIETYAHWYAGKSVAAVDVTEIRRFIADCSRQTADLASASTDLENLERAQLLDLLLRAADLGRVLRRGSRRSARFPLRLISDMPGRGWEEDTETLVVSRHGTSLHCRHPVQNEDILIVIRRDDNRRTTARVVWCREGEHRWEMGLELLQGDDFWGIEWEESSPEPVAPVAPGPSH